MKQIQQIGQQSIKSVERIGRASLFLFYIFKSGVDCIIRFRLVISQIYYVGVLSVLIVSISGFFVGMVLALQGYHVLSQFGQESTLGVMVASAILMELGPVVTALLFAGRAGSALTAEIGLMKTTDQLAGLEMMAVDPIKRIIAPRFFAGVISVPLLTIIFSSLAVFGGYFVGVGLLGVDDGAFWSQIQSKIDFNDDLLNGLLKSFVFGVIVSWLAVFEGYDTVPTSSGISHATTRTVVHSAIAILAVDFILTALML